MEENKQSNLPVKSEEKGLLKGNTKLANITDSIRRVGKIIGAGAVSFVGLGMLVAPGMLPLNIAGFGVLTGGITRLAQNVNLKVEPNLLFGSKKVDDEILIFQDPANIRLASRMAGYENYEKAAMMGMQTLIGLSRYKDNLKDSSFEIGEDGQKIYSQKFATVTHSINLDNLKYLEDLGYIKIDSTEETFKGKTLDEKLTALGSKDGKVKSYLIMEKLGFGNFGGVKDAFKAMRSKDEKVKDENREIMKKVTFRLTDKPLDFEEIANFSNPKVRKSLSPEKRLAVNRLASMSRIMRGRKIEVEKDAFGRDTIKYPTRAENAEINRRRKEAKKERAKKAAINAQVKEATEEYEQMGKDFSERLQKGVDKEKFTKAAEATISIQPEVGEKAKSVDEQPKDEGKSLDL